VNIRRIRQNARELIKDISERTAKQIAEFNIFIAALSRERPYA